MTVLHWLFQLAGRGLHKLADSGWAVVVTIALLFIVYLWLRAAEWFARLRLISKLGSAGALVQLGPAHARAASAVLVVGVVHALTNVLFGLVLWQGPYQFGLEGVLLNAVGLNVLVPLPYSIAFPGALLLYGFVYCVALYALAMHMAGAHNSFAAALFWAIVGAPFFLLTAPLSAGLVGLGKARARRRRKKRKAEMEKAADAVAEAEAQAKEDGEPAEAAPPPAPDSPPDEEDAEEDTVDPDSLVLDPAYDNPQWVLKTGHAAFTVVGDKDGRRVWRLFPRYVPIIQPYLPWAAAAMIIGVLVPFVFSPERSDLSLPIAVDEYYSIVGKDSADPLLPEPLTQGLSSAHTEVLAGLTLEEGHSRKARYECESGTEDALRELGKSELDELVRARLILNAELCRVSHERSFSLRWDSFRAWVTKLTDFRDLKDRMRAVGRAAERLKGSEDGPTARLIEAFVYQRPGWEYEAQRSLEAAIKTADAASLNAVLALSLQANLLVRMSRFDEIRGLFEAYSEKVGGADPDDPKQSALWGVTQLNRAAMLEAIYRQEDAAELYDEVLEKLREQDGLEPLAQMARLRKEALGPEPDNDHWKAEVRLFGPLHASMLAAIVLFILGLLRSLATEQAARREPDPVKKEHDDPHEVPEEVPEEEILKALGEEDFELVASVEVTKGAARGRTGAQAMAGFGDTIGDGASADEMQAMFNAAVKAQKDAPAPAAAAPAAKERKKGPVYKAEPSPVQDFLHSLLYERGFFHSEFKGLYAHQQTALDYVNQESGGEEATTVVLSAAATSGRTTAALFATMERILVHGETVLYLAGTAAHARSLFQFFEGVRAREAWRWNLHPALSGEGIDRADRSGMPINVLFVDIEDLHRRILAPERRMALEGFIASLGLIVVEDIDCYPIRTAAHAAFLFRRLAEFLRQRGVRPVTLVTTMPVMAHEDAFAQELLGPLASVIRVIPEGVDDAEKPAQMVHVFRPVVFDTWYKGMCVEHVMAAVIQAVGCRGSGQTTWKTSLSGYDDSSPARDDRVIEVYRRRDVARQLELKPLDESRAVVYPLRPHTVGALEAHVRHAGIGMPKGKLDAAFLHVDAAEGAVEEVAEAIAEQEIRNSVFLLTGPEPVDLYLARLFDIEDDDSAGAGDADGGVVSIAKARKALFNQRPEGVLPMRNRPMNRFHFEATMQERDAPGQEQTYLEDTFVPDVLEELLTYLDRRGRLDRTPVPRVDRSRKRFYMTTRMFSPRRTQGTADFQVGCYSSDIARVVDSVTDRELTRVERCRARLLFHPGYIFFVDGRRYTVMPPRFQTAWKRGMILAKHHPLDHRSSRIRTVTLAPERRRLAALEHRIGRGAPMLVAMANVQYTERVEGFRLYGSLTTSIESTERFDQHQITESFDTEALILAFDKGSLGEAFGDAEKVQAILHAAAMLLRQVMPLVLRADDWDLEIAWGAGDTAPPDGRRYGFANDLAFRAGNRISGEARLPWLAFIDRMEGGLGYARLLHERLFQGELFKNLLLQARGLADAYARDGKDGIKSSVETSLCVESFEPRDSDPAGARRFLETLLPNAGQEDDRRQSAFLSNMGRARERREREGIAGKRGLEDVLRLRAAEEALAALVAPMVKPAHSDPWCLAALTALILRTPERRARRGVERALLATLSLARRRAERVSLAPPVYAVELGRFQMEEGPGELDGVPELTGDLSLALETEWGPLAEAMGLITGDWQLSQAGTALAEAFLSDPTRAGALDAVIEDAAAGRVCSDDPVKRTTLLGRERLPAVCAPILAAGLAKIDRLARLADLWERADGSVRQRITELAEADASLESVHRRFALLAAYADVDRLGRIVINGLRKALAGEEVMKVEAAAQHVVEDVEALAGASGVCLGHREAGEAAVGTKTWVFLQALHDRATAPVGALQLLLARIDEGSEAASPFFQHSGYIAVWPGWEKKHKSDDSAGMAFRMDAFGDLLAAVGWEPGAAPHRTTMPAPATRASDDDPALAVHADYSLRCGVGALPSSDGGFFFVGPDAVDGIERRVHGQQLSQPMEYGLVGRRVGVGRKGGEVIRLSYSWAAVGRRWWLLLEMPVDAYMSAVRTERFWHDYAAHAQEPGSLALTSAIADEVQRVARENGCGETEIADVVVKLVQHLFYALDDATTGLDEYPKFPLETLVDGQGDCEDVALLAAALLRHLAGVRSAVVTVGPARDGHMVAGFVGLDVPGRDTVSVGGETWSVVEATNPFALGEWGPDSSRDVREIATLEDRPYIVLQEHGLIVGPDGPERLEAVLFNRGFSDAADVSCEFSWVSPSEEVLSTASESVGSIAVGASSEVVVSVPPSPAPSAELTWRIRAGDFVTNVYRRAK